MAKRSTLVSRSWRGEAKAQAEAGFTRMMNTFARLTSDPPPNPQGMSNQIALAHDELRDALYKKGLDCFCNWNPTGEEAGNYRPAGGEYLCYCEERKPGTKTQQFKPLKT